MHFRLFDTIILLWIVISGCCSVKSNNDNIQLDEQFILSVQRKLPGREIENDVVFYCLVRTNKEKLKKILNDSYSSVYSFYDTIGTSTNATCILSYWEHSWEISCGKGEIDLSNHSISDSTVNSNIIKTLRNRTNYCYKEVVTDNNNLLKIRLHIGIAKPKIINYCKIVERGFCDLKSDTVIILKPGFDLVKQKI